jgi:hypothetical protein
LALESAASPGATIRPAQAAIAGATENKGNPMSTSPILPDDTAEESVSSVVASALQAQLDVPAEVEPIPAMQQVLDNPFLLLFIGVTVPTVFYIIWGIMEIVSIPMAR